MRILFVTAPADIAAALVRTLVEERLVACGNILPGVRSIYRWEGAIHDDPEVVILMETRTERAAAAQARIEALHPYDVPKIVTLAPTDVNAAYLAWVTTTTA